eukprot:TRINITY_DN9318_c0_g1_i1.p1 TRINITY_DN9318_c0_g1~~TRINITY_DN9318_c0_g1_i1.p1  ORF type:complete len:1644 (+),score=679.36 TRINITY_DN9318_c0_g1_i1:56-4933(+)
MSENDCSVTVAVRVRPLNSRELSMNSKVIVKAETTHAALKLEHEGNKKPHDFCFDHIWNSIDPSAEDFASQETVYNDVGKKVLSAAFQGYNACIFAYGQTGSGKTFCMMGVPGNEELEGVIPRLSKAIFERINAKEAPPNGVVSVHYQVEASYLEIYQERVKCLLNPKKENLKVREHPVTGPYVEDLTKLVIGGQEEVLRLIEEGSAVRQVAATNMNDQSSRSHAIFTLILTQTKVYQEGGEGKKRVAHDTVSKINLVDLAGSERAKSTGATGTRLQEGAGINKSLTTLGLVISGLAEMSKKGKAPHIPFRDSTLTWLLKDNLGGNSKTFMISAISPADVNHDETLSTLRYADRAKQIVTKAKVNEDPNTKLIRQLREELAKYKAKLDEYENSKVLTAIPTSIPTLQGAGQTLQTPRGMQGYEVMPTPRGMDGMATPRVPHNSREAAAMKDKLEAMEKLMLEAGMTPEEKEAASKIEQRRRLSDMKELGIKTLHADPHHPHFVNMILDGSWMIHYLAPNDEVKVGASAECALVLHENGVLPVHAVVKCVEKEGGGFVVTITPTSEDAALQVHGLENQMEERGEILLQHGATIDIGENMFRFVDPSISADEREARRKRQIEALKAVREGSREPTLTEQGQAIHTDPHAKEELRKEIRAQIMAEQEEKLRKEEEERAKEEEKTAEELKERLRAQIMAEQEEKQRKDEEERERQRQKEEAERAEEEERTAEELKERIRAQIMAEQEEKLRIEEEEKERQRQLDRAEEAEELRKQVRAEVLAEQERLKKEEEESLREQESMLAEKAIDEEELRKQIRAQILAEQEEKQKEEEKKQSARMQVPILKLHEMSGSSSTLKQIGTSRLPKVGDGFLKPKTENPLSSRGSPSPGTARSQVQEATVQIFKQTLVLVGDAGVGKTSVRKCLLKEPSFWEKKDVPLVTPTLGVDHAEVKVNIQGNQVVMLIEDPSGNPLYATTQPFCIPTQRSIVAVVWDLSDRFNEDALRQRINNARMHSPTAAIMLIGTHRDACREGDDGIQKLITVVEQAVLMSLAGCTFLGTFAVSCKNRTVQHEGKTVKFKELLRMIAQAAHDRCLQDANFLNGNVPSSVVTLARKIIEMRTQGSWMVTSTEFKATASSAASRYHFDIRELGRVTSLLDSWRVLLHYGAHPTLRKQVFTDPIWLYGVLNVLNIYNHYYSENASTYSGTGIHANSKTFTISELPFVPSDAFAKDPTNSFTRGILTLPLAMVLFKHHLALIKRSIKDVSQCIQLLMYFDLLYPVIPPQEGQAILPTTDLPDQRQEDETPIYLLPFLFTHPFPSVLTDVMPSLMNGSTKKVVFEPGLPEGLFARLTTRIARCVKRLYVGKLENLTQDPSKNILWKSGGWVQDSDTTRLMYWVAKNEIYLCTNVRSGEGLPCRRLMEGVMQSIRSLVGEHQGCTLKEMMRCPVQGCSTWVVISDSASVRCEGCGSELVPTEVLEATGCLVPEKKEDTMRYSEVFSKDDGERVNELIDMIEQSDVAEPSPKDVEEANTLIDGILQGDADAPTQGLEKMKYLLGKVDQLNASNDTSAAEGLEKAINVTSTYNKLVSSARALDQLLELLTNPPPIKVNSISGLGSTGERLAPVSDLGKQ